ncbi:MAG: hypothetical protein K6T34_07830 [Thermoflavifilum sp.]|nr:hypothetical protein [Thermoflavifilum sp.]
MKKTFLVLFLLVFSGWAFAQNKLVRKAEDAFKNKNYNEALTDIQQALQDPKTGNQGKTWYLSGEIHGAIATEKKDPQEAWKAFEAYQKAVELSPKDPEILLTLSKNLSDIYVVMGNAAYADVNTQKFDSAYDKFMRTWEIARFLNDKGVGSIPTDTAMVFYTGYVALQSHHEDTAFAYFQKAAQLGFDKEPYLYYTLANMYMDRNQFDSAVATAEEGKKLFPTNDNFNNLEIQLYEKAGKTNELISKLENEVQQHPDNYNLILNLAIIYDNLAHPTDEQGNDTTPPANAQELEQKAIDMYKKAIALKPDDYPANFNLGLLYYNNAAKYGRELGQLGSSQQEMQKAQQIAHIQDSLLNLALPYLDKTYHILDAKSKLNQNEMLAYKNALSGLKAIYARKNETDKYNEVKAKYDQADSKAE